MGCPAVLLSRRQEKKLDSSKTLRQAGIPAEGAVLRLDVTGDGGSGASGPPITIKVRVEGGKTFTVSTTTVSRDAMQGVAVAGGGGGGGGGRGGVCAAVVALIDAGYRLG